MAEDNQAEIAATLATISTNISHINKHMDNMDTRLTKIEADLNVLHNRITEAHTRVGLCESKIADHTEHWSNFKNKEFFPLRELVRRHNALATTIASILFLIGSGWFAISKDIFGLAQ